jgi:hypothetical protein
MAKQGFRIMKLTAVAAQQKFAIWEKDVSSDEMVA